MFIGVQVIYELLRQILLNANLSTYLMILGIPQGIPLKISGIPLFRIVCLLYHFKKQ